MQVKVVIATIAFMMAMMILGFAALREPQRLEEYTLAEHGRSVEAGADLFKQNCVSCHGENGQALDCGDASCVGLPLNSAGLLCGDKSARMEALGWIGSKQAFVEMTISSGRSGYIMPAWLNDFGGPLRPDQVRNLADYVLNWESEELCAEPIFQYEWPESIDDFLVEFPDGDAVAGKEAYLSQGCNACHGIPDEGVAAAVGPELGNISVDGATRIDGYSAEQYIYESILDPSSFIAPDCPTGPCGGPPSAMRADYPASMGNTEEKPQSMTDILTYLLSLSE